MRSIATRSIGLITIVTAGAAALVLGVAACGGGYGGSSPSNPNAPSGPPAGAITIDIIGINGAQSFSPNPSAVPAGQLVVWHNRDRVTHRVVLDDGELDSGNITPGAYSGPMALVAPGPYHCSIHPEMVGRITGGP